MNVNRFLIHEAIHAARTGTDAYGNAVFSSGATISCRVQVKRRLTSGADGLVASAETIVASAVELKTGDRITYGGMTYHVAYAEHGHSLDGDSEMWIATLA